MNNKDIVLTDKEIQGRCDHSYSKHISSFSNRILVCNECGKFFNRYEYKINKGRLNKNNTIQ